MFVGVKVAGVAVNMCMDLLDIYIRRDVAFLTSTFVMKDLEIWYFS